jgi:murein DD-endopeptidase MepM/ murein hydrolase activator NlpD
MYGGPVRLTHLAFALANLALTAGPAKKKPKVPEGQVHVVRKGETAASIARKHGLSLAQLEALNPGKNLARLSLGSRLALAKGRPSAAAGPSHVFQAGETLHSLAKAEGLSVQDILAVNPGLKPSRIKVGTRIALPGPVSTTPTAAEPAVAAIAPIPMVPMPGLPGPRARSLANLERLLPTPAKAEPAPVADDPAKPARQPLSQSLNPILPPDAQPAVEPAESVSAFLPADPNHLDLLWPVETRTVSSQWGPRMRTKTVRVKNQRKKRVRYKGRHRGVDLNAPLGTSVFAAMDGQVVTVGKHRQYGNYVVVDHGNGVVTLYAHHRLNLVQEGDIVHRGQKIAEVGRTGNATGPHLHFELRLNGERANPLPYLNDEEEIPAELQAMNALSAR